MATAASPSTAIEDDPVSSSMAEATDVPALLKLVISRLDSLDNQLRKQGAEQSFEIRKLEKALAVSSSGAEAPAVTPRWAHTAGAVRTGAYGQLSQPSGNRRTAGGSYMDELIQQRMSRSSQNDRASRASRSSRSSHHDAEGTKPAWPPKLDERSSPAAEEQARGAAARLEEATEPPPPASPRTAARLGGGLVSRKSRLVAELAQREPRRGSLAGGVTGMDRRASASGNVLRLSSTTSVQEASNGDDSNGSARESPLERHARLQLSGGSLPRLGSSSCSLDESSMMLTREDRLRLMINEDKNVEELLTRIRRAENCANTESEKEYAWEAHHPVSTRLVLLPGSAVKAWWDVVMLLLVLLSAVTMPLDLAFTLTRASAMIVLFMILDASFVFDFFITFRIAYVTEASHLVVRQPRRILVRWFTSGWFAFDLLAALPLASLDLIDFPGAGAGATLVESS